MKYYDVIVVGAGPAGSMTAKHAAKNGASVLLIEKRQEIGSPVRCGEAISKRWFKDVGIQPSSKWIANEVKGAKITSPDGSSLYIDEKIAGREVGTVIERDIFDMELAKDAVKAGAETMLKTSVYGLIQENGKVIGVKAKHLGETFEINAKVVVGADGFESQVGRWAGIDTSLKPRDISTCLQYRMTNIDCDPDHCEFIIGDVSIGGYVWVFPKDDDTANIGVGLLLSKIHEKGMVKAYLDNFIKKHPEYSKGSVMDIVAGAVSVCAPIDRTVGDGIVLVGDAARQIDPMTGGGVANACIAGKVAGEVLGKSVKENDFSEGFLVQYEKGWRKRFEESLFRNWIAKEKLISLGNENINKIVRTLAEVGVEKLTILDILKILTDKYPELVEELQGLV